MSEINEQAFEKAMDAALNSYADIFRVDVRSFLTAYLAHMEADEGRKDIKATAEVSFTTGHCEEKRKPGGCRLHNLHCAYPTCDRRPAPPTIKTEAVA